jgi:1-acyl-sn-glycerol-3-phosphate acyltransferase
VVFNGRRVYRALQWIGRSIFTPVWPMTVTGRDRIPKSGGVVVISNHQSYLDLILLGQAIDREITYIARTGLWSSPLYRALTWPFRLVRIRRGEADLSALKECVGRLERGELLLLFPEGTRTRDGRVGRFTMGFLAMAQRARVPVVPARVFGSFEAWPRSHPLPSPGRIRLEFFPPIDAAGRRREEIVDQLQSGVYATPGPAVGRTYA